MRDRERQTALDAGTIEALRREVCCQMCRCMCGYTCFAARARASVRVSRLTGGSTCCHRRHRLQVKKLLLQVQESERQQHILKEETLTATERLLAQTRVTTSLQEDIQVQHILTRSLSAPS